MSRNDSLIVNPVTGQTMRFIQTAAGTGGALLQIESVNVQGPGDSEHVHPLQESTAEVISGTLHFRIRGEEHVVRTGERIVIPANTPHCFWNEDEEEAVSIQEFRPALRTEEFFRTYFSLARDGKLGKDGLPSILQLAVIIPAFGNEIRPTSPPWPILKAVSTLLSPLARARGYRAEYS